jgi:hypothetical protein
MPFASARTTATLKAATRAGSAPRVGHPRRQRHLSPLRDQRRYHQRSRHLLIRGCR